MRSKAKQQKKTQIVIQCQGSYLSQINQSCPWLVLISSNQFTHLHSAITKAWVQTSWTTVNHSSCWSDRIMKRGYGFVLMNEVRLQFSMAMTTFCITAVESYPKFLIWIKYLFKYFKSEWKLISLSHKELIFFVQQRKKRKINPHWWLPLKMKCSNMQKKTIL